MTALMSGSQAPIEPDLAANERLWRAAMGVTL
jgi:hypothetical protein